MRAGFIEILQAIPVLPEEDDVLLKPENLKGLVYFRELMQDRQALTTILAHPDLVGAFKEHCKRREEKNAGTSLSYFRAPNSPSNRMHKELALLLFSPETTGQLLGVLTPALTTLITPRPEIEIKVGQKLRTADIDFSFETSPLNALNFETPFLLDELCHFVVHGNMLFDARTISSFTFPIHRLHAERLREFNKGLLHQLFCHNGALRSLENHLSIELGDGRLPLAVVQSFIKELILGGSTKTSLIEASVSAKVACIEFQRYVDVMPKKMRKNFLALRGEKTIAEVLKALSQEGCVEEAAADLKVILENPRNRPLLETNPQFSKEDIKKLTSTYGPKNPLPTEAEESDAKYPSELLEKTLARVTIFTASDLLNLLLDFSPDFYSTIIEKSNLMVSWTFLEELAQMLASGILNNNQLAAFNNAVMSSHGRLGGRELLIDFALLANNLDCFTRLFKEIPIENRQAYVNKFCANKNSLLHRAILKPPFFEVILQELPKKSRLLAIDEANKGESNIPLLILATKHSSLLQYILDLYLPEERLARVKKATCQGDSLLHAAARNKESLSVLLHLYPQHERLAALKQKNNEQLSVLDLVVQHSGCLKVVLELLPQSDHARIILDEEGYVLSLLHRSASDPDSLQMLLNLIPNEEHAEVAFRKHHNQTLIFPAVRDASSLGRVLSLYGGKQSVLSLVGEINSLGERPLHQAALSLSSMQKILDCYPTLQARFEALTVRDNKGFTPLHNIRDLKILACILKPFTAEDRQVLLKQRNKRGDTVLHLLMDNPDALELLPKIEMLSFVDETNEAGYTLIHQSALFKNTLQRLLWLIPIHERLPMLLKRTKLGDTVLHIAARNLADFDGIFELFKDRNDALASLELMNHRGETVLHLAAGDARALDKILSIYDDTARLHAVRRLTCSGASVIHYAFKDLRSVAILLKLFPQAERINIFLEKNSQGIHVLQKIANNFGAFQGYNGMVGDISHHVASFQTILKLFPKEKRSQLFTEKLSDGSNLAMLIAKSNPELLNYFLRYIPEADHFSLIKAKDGQQNTLLPWLLGSPKTLQAMISKIPTADRLNLFRQKNNQGKSLLDLAKAHPASLEVIHRCIPTINYSFYFNCIAAVSVICGIVALALSLIYLQPILIGLTAALIVGSATRLAYSFFSKKKPDPTASPPQDHHFQNQP